VKAVKYQACYLWECPECGTTWQARHRPRGGMQLVCAALAEQRAVGPVPAVTFRGCGSVSVSAGRRGGIAPNVSI
jgi:hypothetical protein